MAFLQDLLSSILMANLHLIILSILISSALLFFIFLLFRIKKTKKQEPIQKITPSSSSVVVTSQDIRAIAGDDVMATQLDLARAYIEMGKKKLAKKILDHVVEHGDAIQQQQANKLITVIEVS